MRKIFLLLSVFLFSVCSLIAQTDGDNTEMGLSYYNQISTNLTGFGRDVFAGSDMDNDGKPEIVLTQYQNGGAVTVFEVIGDNQLEEVWRSPDLGSPYGSCVRSVKVADLDGNGTPEIISYINSGWSTVSDTVGLIVFQWDGVTDNNYVEITRFNYANNPALQDTGAYRCEDIAIADFDNDSQLEVAFTRWIGGDQSARTVSIYSVTGDFATGFFTWIQEYQETRYYLNTGGSMTGAYYADLDKDGHGELWVGVYDYLSLRCIESSGPNAYADSANTYYIDKLDSVDSYIIKGFVHGDIDQDGTNEILVESTYTGRVWLLKAVGDVKDSVSVTELSFLKPGPFTTLALGDQDHTTGGTPDGIDLYSGGTTKGIVDYEFIGGSLTDSASWVRYEYGADTLVIDTLKNQAGEDSLIVYYKQPSWMVFAPDIDLDGDGNKELVTTYLLHAEAGGTADADSLYGIPIPPEKKKWIRIFEFGAASTGIEEKWEIITPDQYVLEQNYPNPFNPTTSIEFYLPINKKISLTIYNALGQKVKTLINNEMIKRGSHLKEWDSTNSAGVKVASGMYIYELKFGNFTLSKRMMLLK